MTLGDRVESDGRVSITTGYSSRLNIGSGVYFNDGAVISCLGKIDIGDNTLFGPGVKIFDNNHRFSREEGVSRECAAGCITVGRTVNLCLMNARKCNIKVTAQILRNFLRNTRIKNSNRPVDFQRIGQQIAAHARRDFLFVLLPHKNALLIPLSVPAHQALNRIQPRRIQKARINQRRPHYLRFGDHPFLNLIPVHLRRKIISSQMRQNAVQHQRHIPDADIRHVYKLASVKIQIERTKNQHIFHFPVLIFF